MSGCQITLTNLRKMRLFLGPRATRLLILAVAVGLCLYVVELALAYGLQAFLGLLLNHGEPVSMMRGFPRLTMKSALTVILFFGIWRSLLTWTQLYTQGVIQENFKYVQRRRILQWAFSSASVSATYVNTLFSERVTNSSYAVVNSLVATVNTICALALGITLLFVSPLLTLGITAFLIILSIPLRAVSHKLVYLGERLVGEWDSANRRLTMSLKNLLLMQIYGREKIEEEKGAAELTKYASRQYLFHFLAGFKFIFPQLIGIFLICGIAVFSTKTKIIEAASLISYFYVLMRLLQNMAEVMRAASNIRFYKSSFLDLARWWSEHAHDGLHKRDLIERPTGLVTINEPLGWDLKDVSFKYPEGRGMVLDQFNLKIKPGEFVVVVGKSGAGKSTLLNLLLGGIQVTQGQIRASINSKSATDLNQVRASLLRAVGYVGPESFLIEGTIRENIFYGLEQEPDENQLAEALKLAQCDFVNELPQRLNHFISEQGQGLSAGQKQRLSLARALLRNPKALFLDEATSNLDFGTEARLIESFAGLKGKMTVIAVTHREAMTKLADQVVKL